MLPIPRLDAVSYTHLDVYKRQADMPCVHLEGPYFAPSQKGAQPEEYLRCPDPAEYGEILEKYGDLIGRWSAASELAGTEAFARACRQRGILVAYAHSDTDTDQAIEANRWGFTHYTHLYSCMSSVHRRQGRRYGGLVESAYLMEDTTAELITDGMHLPPALAELAYRCKGADKVLSLIHISVDVDGSLQDRLQLKIADDRRQYAKYGLFGILGFNAGDDRFILH